MNFHVRFRQALLASFIALAGASASFASATATRECPEPSKEDREKMAVAHEQMAVCLRSAKTFIECHQELAKSQRQMMGLMHCANRTHTLPHGDAKSDGHPGPKE
jgi:hypothetical protein